MKQDREAPQVDTLWAVPWPLELRATLAPLQHGPADPSVRLVPDGAWRALRTASGPATVRLSAVPGGAHAGSGRAPSVPGGAHSAPGSEPRATGRSLLSPAHGDAVRIQAWGPGAVEAAAAAPAWMGALDDWSGFDSPAFASTLPESVAATRRQRPGLRLPSGGALLDTLCVSVLEQRVTGIEAHYAWARLLREYGERAPGPTLSGAAQPGPSLSGATRAARGTGRPASGVLMVPPTGAAWRAIPSWAWHQARVDPARRNTLVAVAERSSAWARLESGSDLGELERAIRSLRGIGVWTAAETLQRTHGAPDHVSFGDFHVAHFVGQALTGSRADDAGMEALLAPWAGHRQRVVRLLMASGAKNPSYGPRLAPQDHRGH